MPGSHIERYRYIFIQHWSEQAMRVEGRVARGHCGAGLQQAVCFLFYIIYLPKHIETVKQLTVRTPPTTPRKYRSVQ